MPAKKKNEKRNNSQQKNKKANLKKINYNVSGIDLSSEEMFIAIVDKGVRRFSTFTRGLEEASCYLKLEGIEKIVMEATGIYWIPVYEHFEKEGFDVSLVNGAHAKNVPGRKTDVLDSEWLRELHTYGLLRASFIPEAEIRELRYYVRLRDDHIAMGATHINIIQKNLDMMNIKLHKVIDSVMSKSGLLIVRAILDGVRNPEKLWELCQEYITDEKRQGVIDSLKGNYRKEYLFGISQALQMWEQYQLMQKYCDKEIEKLLQKMTIEFEDPQNLSTPKRMKQNKPEIEDFHRLMVKLTGGNDTTAIAGINDYSALKIIAETGLDFSKFKNEKHFTSWLGLAPSAHQSGKKKRRKGRRHCNRAGFIFRQLAVNVGNGKHTALSSFYKRIRSRAGKMIAIKATARKIAVYFFHLMTKGIAFVEEGIKKYEKRYAEQQRKFVERKAHEMGYILVKV
jgi:transposase